MILRQATVFGFLVFISLSTMCTGALAQTVDEVAAVQKLKLEGDELAKKGLNSEAIERYKDCICLLELQNWNPEKKREFLKGASKEPVKPIVKSPLFNSQGADTSLFERHILRFAHVRRPDDIPTALEMIRKSQLNVHEDRDLILSLLSEVSSVKADTTEQKRIQIECLLALVSTFGSSLDDKQAFCTLQQLAMELDTNSNPKDADLQNRALSRALYGFIETRDSDLREINALREITEDCISLMEKQPDKISIDLRSPIDRLIQFSELRSLVPLLERYTAMQKKRYLPYPQHYMFDVCNLGWAYMSAGRYADAQKLFEDTSSICKNNMHCLQQYEFSELSLAQCLILQKRTRAAKQKLEALIKFLADPGIADVSQYGAIAEGMLGEIEIGKKNWKLALAHLMRADERLLLITNFYPAIYAADFVREQLPSERLVLEDLATVYKKLNLPQKAHEAEKFAADLKSTKKVNTAVSRRQNRVNLVYISSVPDADSAIDEYCDAILASVKDQAKLLDSLMSLIEQCTSRGLSKAGLRCVDEALKLDTNLVEKYRVKLILSKAEFLLLQNKFDLCRKELEDLASEKNEPASVWMASSMIARSYLREGKYADAETRLQQLLSEPNLSTTLGSVADSKQGLLHPSESKLLFLKSAEQAYTDLAEILISQGKHGAAEFKLKASLQTRARLSMSVQTGREPLQYSLLAYAEALQGKTSESEMNLRAATSSTNSIHGLLVARTKTFEAGTFKALGNSDRARRFYYEALQEFESILPPTDLEVVTCREKLQKLIPDSKL